ncbi:MAG: hypothetical protein ACX939_05000 [Hyphococcus sp.]
MIDAAYVAQQVRGVWRMAFGGAGDWRDDIDRTTDGVFRSLWAIALALPLVALNFMAARRAIANNPMFAETALATAPAGILLTAELVALVIYWGANLGVLLSATRSLKASRRVADVIVGYNWGRLMTVAILAAPAAVLGATGNVSIFVVLYLPALALAISILWGVLRQSLSAGVGMTLALLILLMLIEIIINTVITNGAVALFQSLS